MSSAAPHAPGTTATTLHESPSREPAADPVPELVVLLDERRRPAGTAEKAGVHTRDTPLHLAFSCYVTDGDGALLLTRRAVTKRTWPGVWTNSACGHPGPDEPVEAAVARRVRQELGLEIDDLRPAVPDFAYRAVDASGVVENEVCPVFTAVARGEVRPDPAEVEEWRWVPWGEVETLARTAPWALSPWSVLQLGAMAAARA